VQAAALLQEEARTGNFGEQAESEIQGYTNQKNSSESKVMWKKMGVKELGTSRGNNLWGHPLIPSSLTNSSPSRPLSRPKSAAPTRQRLYNKDT